MMSSMVIILFLLSTIKHGEGVERVEARCKHPARDRCSWEVHSMAIRCDQTNVTSIPDPTGIHALAPPEEAPYLFVNHSCIHYINPGGLAKYKNLMFLDLCENYIRILPRRAFGKAKKLQKLFIAGNEISHIDKEAFTGLDVLMYLHLGNNRLRRISGGSLEVVGTTLLVLKLNNNRLEAIDASTFSGLTQLQTLDLSGNKLHKFEPDRLRGLGMLRIIHLQENNLTSFHKHIFLAAPRVEEVDLSNNSIACLDDDVFDSEKLSVVKLSGNPLKTPSTDWISFGEKKGYVEITSSGAWVCNCQVYSYNNYLKSMPEEEKDRYDVQCYSPKVLKGKMLSTLSWHHLSTYSNCTVPDEPLKCLQPVRSPVSPKTTTKRRTHRTTSSLSPTTRTATNYPVIIAIERQRTAGGRTTEVSPLDSPPPEFVWEKQHTIYAVVGVVSFVFICLLVFLFYKIIHRKEKQNPSSGNARGKRVPLISESSQESNPINPHSRMESVVGLMQDRFRDLQTHIENPCQSVYGPDTRPIQRASSSSYDHAETLPKVVDTFPQSRTIPGYLNQANSIPPSSHIYASMTSVNPPSNRSSGQERLEPQGGSQQPGPMTQRQAPIGSSQEQSLPSTSRSSFGRNVSYNIRPTYPLTHPPSAQTTGRPFNNGM